MSAPDALLRIGDFARLTGTNLRTLRYYEELGLLAPAARSAGGFRHYRAADANRVRLIRDLQEVGLSLERIRDLVAAPGGAESRAAFLQRTRAALAEHDRLLCQRIAAIEAQRLKVAEAVLKTAECRDCRHSPCAENNYCEPCPADGATLPAHLSALYRAGPPRT